MCTTGNYIADGTFEDFLNSCSSEEPIKCEWCKEVHEEDEVECLEPEINNREYKEYKYNTTKPNDTNRS